MATELSTNIEEKQSVAIERIERCHKKREAFLDLSGLNLNTIPAEVGKLVWLRHLNISQNNLAKLPNEITELSALDTLVAGENRFRSFPAQIRSFQFLRELDLSANQIGTIPAWITSLAYLESFDIGLNNLTTIPAHIGKMTELQSLLIYGNELEALPEELGRLSNLHTLTAFGNQLRRLPENIGDLQNLEVLDLYSNNIVTLPSSFSKLINLVDLDIGDNPLGKVPPVLSSLPNLTTLHLANTRTKKLPEWLQDLPLLARLDLTGNPALKLSPAILGEKSKHIGDPATASAGPILDFYFGRKIGQAQPLNEVKLILVGRGGAGKTSTVRALRGQPFDDSESSTAGIALCDWTMTGSKGEPITAHVWDFAGQVITHALHQFFFSTRSVYVLVLTGRENNERDDAEYWLRLIKAFGTDENGSGPPVLVALNKWDLQGCRPRIDREALKDRYPFIRAFVEMDCKSGKGIQTLKSTLHREAARLKWVRDPFPESWDRVRRALTVGSGKKAHLTYSAYRALCHSNGISEYREQDSLAEILHNLGVALNYKNDPRLREATVLQPEWLTKNVYSLVRRAEKHSGILKQSDIASVLRYEKDEEMRLYLLRIMERFEIAYSPRGASDIWLVPQALPDQQAKGAAEFRDASNATRLRYSYQALPEGLVARAIVRLNEFIEEVGGKRQQWASGVIIERAGARALIRTEPQDRRVLITVTGNVKARQQLAGLCQVEMRDIHAEIRGLDPVEETLVQGTWVSINTLELDERNNRKTGVPTKDQGTVLIDPSQPNNEYSEKRSRSDQWKPTVFISYSKSNVAQRKQLEIQLKILMNEGLVERLWHDRMIDPGDDWDGVIKQQLKDANIIIILVSGAALSTDYITKYEIPEALGFHESKQAVVIPVILEACRWTKTELGALNALPEKGNPVNKWKPPADGWNSIANGLATICENLIKDYSSTKDRTKPKRTVR